VHEGGGKGERVSVNDCCMHAAPNLNDGNVGKCQNDA